MSDMKAVEELVNSYIGCWSKNRPEFRSGIYEDNDFGCEHLQIFRNGFTIEDFSHEELCELAVQLTRSLRGQINRDHKMYWSWCSFMAQYFREQVHLFQDTDWVEAFSSLVDLLLAEERPQQTIPGYSKVTKESLKYVNSHLIALCFKKHILAGSQSFIVLDGLLRRKASRYVSIDGIVRNSFTIMEPGKGAKTVISGSKMNRINDGLRLFVQLITRDRQRSCPAFRSLEREVLELYPRGPNIYELIDEWSNDLFHGREYWQIVTPIVVNMICFLVIDEIKPDIYDDALPEIRRQVSHNQLARAGANSVYPWDTFPPDLTL